MGRFARPCLKCGNVSTKGNSYCDSHYAEVIQAREAKRSQDPRRKAKKKLLYNSDYRKARDEIVTYVRQYGSVCYICKKAILPTHQIDIDHITPGVINSQLAPTHRFCNRSRGNRG